MRAGLLVNLDPPPRLKYGLVTSVLKIDTSLLEAYFASRGWERTYGPDWEVLWYVGRDPPREVLLDLRPDQRMSHFPRISRLINKATIGDTLSAAGLDGDEISPRTWRLPEAREAFEAHARERSGQAWIHKPVSGSWGKGITVFRDYLEVPNRRNMLVQRYLDDPMTVDGRKFNLRVYLLITAIEPLEAWVYRDGYVDLASAPFTCEGKDALDPLVFNTNTHVQTDLTGLDAASCSMSMREWLDDQDAGGTVLWDALLDMLAVLARAVAAGLRKELDGYLAHPRNCFELLGLDVQFDRAGKPWLIECNRSPELAALSSKAIKERLIRDLFRIVRPEDDGAGPGRDGECGFESIVAPRPG